MSDPLIFLDGRVTLHPGDCMEVVRSLAENSVDSIVTDPPYHLHSIVKRLAKTGRTESTRTTSGPHQRTATGFMGRQWDGGDIAFRPETWIEALRVLKPGGYIVAFSSSRTFGRMSVAMEEAGFITHPMIGWIFAQGFPKAHRVHAEGWEGWRYGGQSLKPALEPIYVGQKPFSEVNGTANVQRWGTGAINVDGCRIGEGEGGARDGEQSAQQRYTDRGSTNFAPLPGPRGGSADGRWPANLILDDSQIVFDAFPDAPGQQGDVRGDEPSEPLGANTYGRMQARVPASARKDSGSAARFFFQAKADSDDRLGSRHPTVKPVDLIQYLVRMVTPPKGIVLDLFAGTGTTGEAAYREGFSAILIERETEYQADIARRMGLVLSGRDERRRSSIKAKGAVTDAGPLFAGGAA